MLDANPNVIMSPEQLERLVDKAGKKASGRIDGKLLKAALAVRPGCTATDRELSLVRRLFRQAQGKTEAFLEALANWGRAQVEKTEPTAVCKGDAVTVLLGANRTPTVVGCVIGVGRRRLVARFTVPELLYHDPMSRAMTLLLENGTPLEVLLEGHSHDEFTFKLPDRKVRFEEVWK